MIIVCTGKTAEIITLSVLGALSLYIISMLALIRLRKSAPSLNRPFRVPLYPVTPYIALILSLLSMVAVCYYNLTLAGLFFGLIGFFFLVYKLIKK